MRQKIKIALMSYAMDNRPAKGTSLYARKIINGILSDERFDVTLFHFDKTNDPIYKNAKEIIFPKIKMPFGSRFFSQLFFLLKYKGERYDIVHWFQPRLYPFFWLFPSKKKIVTVHGAGDISVPPNRFIFSREVFNFILKHYHKFLGIIIVDSFFAKKEVIQYYGFPESKVFSIYLGGSEDYHFLDKIKAKEVVAVQYGIKDSYILNISRLQPNKNIKSLILAYNDYREKNINKKEKLVIVAKKTSFNTEEYEIANRSKYFKDIIFIDYIDQEYLNYIYSASSLFVFPSLNEGFGLPVLEAMASGVPVITSNTTSLPEVAGPSSLCVDPLDIKKLSEAINMVLSNSILREKMVSEGLVYSSKFKWSDTINKTIGLYLK